MANQGQVNHEISLLQRELRRLGTKNKEGQYVVKYGVLFKDDTCANIFEALAGTLKSAKKKKIIKYAGELLLQGVSDNVDIILLQGNDDVDKNDNNNVDKNDNNNDKNDNLKDQKQEQKQDQ